MNIHSHLLERDQRIPFAGLTPKDDGTIPSPIADAIGVNTSPDASFKDVVRLLPSASEGELRSVNPFVNEDGTLDAKALRGALDDDDSIDVDVDDLLDAPEDIDPAKRLQRVTDYIDVVDERRQALNAIGHDCKFRWQIATDNYAIINPVEAYNPAQRTFRTRGEADTIFGWADLQDYGGEVDIYILFQSHTIQSPEASFAADLSTTDATEHSNGSEPDTPDNDDINPIYVGIQTGYNFTGGRAFDSQIFGFDAERLLWLYNLGPRNTRRHVGEAQVATQDISDWWDTEYERIKTYTDELYDLIINAESVTVDFTTVNYTIKEFYATLGIPEEDYADPAAKIVSRLAPKSSVSLWALSHSLLEALEANFEAQGTSHKHTSATFRAYAEIATNLLRNPERKVTQVTNDLQNAPADDETTENHTGMDPDQTELFADDIDSVDGVTIETPSTLQEKRQAVSRKQESLLNF